MGENSKNRLNDEKSRAKDDIVVQKTAKRSGPANKEHGSSPITKIMSKKEYLIAMAVGTFIGLCCLLATLAIILINKPLAEPTLTLDGVEELRDFSNENNLITVTGDLTTNCQLESSLGENLHPIRESSSLEESTIKDDTYSKYAEYDAAWCDVVLNGQYTADTSLEVDLISNDEDYKITQFNNGKLQIIKRYKIYADLVGQPDGTAQNIEFTMTGKKRGDKNSTDSVILIYNLNMTALLSDTDKNFFSDWGKKIDERVAQKIAEEERKKEEEARLAEEQKQRDYENAVNTALTLSYTDLFRNAESYRGKYIKVTGKILQTDSSNSYCRIGTKKNKYYVSSGYYVDSKYYSADDVVYVENCDPKGTKLLEGDVITVIGIGDGTKTYTTVLGADVEIPLVLGKYFWMVQAKE